MLWHATATGTHAPITDILRAPVLVRVTDFEEDDVKAFAAQLSDALLTGQPMLPVVIHSYGGDVYGLCAMRAMLDAYPLPVVTIVEGLAASAAMFLFACGDRRYMAPDATLMIHDLSTNNSGKTEEVKADTAELDRLSAQLFADLAVRCDKPPGYFEAQLDQRKHADWYLPAKEAKRHGLAHGIGIPSLAVAVAPAWTCLAPDGTSLTTLPPRVTVRATPVDTKALPRKRTASRQDLRDRRRA